MKPIIRLSRLAYSLCFTIFLNILLVRCEDIPVNVELHASFYSPPYLLELLETAADENATAYFPILDRIADGHFAHCQSDKELYEKFVRLLQDEGHVTSPEALSSFNFAISIHSVAPRIEAHYQFYNTAVKPRLIESGAEECALWVELGGEQICSIEVWGSGKMVYSPEKLPFDRLQGTTVDTVPSILYADITSSDFGKFHKMIIDSTAKGKTSYRLRYKPVGSGSRNELTLLGYGVELALKRTDYIVIDDRDGSSATENHTVSPSNDGTNNDLQPLTASQLRKLGIKAASYAMASADPFQQLLDLVQDFPKYSSAITEQEISQEFLAEHEANREMILPKGYNVLWMNGLQIEAKEVDAFGLLASIRKERDLINDMTKFRLTPLEAINLLSHQLIAQATAQEKPQRYDFRDDIEGGNAIIWMNNVEKDKRYANWPHQMEALLQRSYPGQLPPVRRDIHNVILAIDFTNAKDVSMVTETVQAFVKRTVPVRFGLVPLTLSPESATQAAVIYHLIDTYGLASAMKYLTLSLADRRLSYPYLKAFEDAIDEKIPRNGQHQTLLELLEKEDSITQVDAAKRYTIRVGLNDNQPTFLVNGVYLSRGDDWLQDMSAQITSDLRYIQQLVYAEKASQSAWLPSYLLEGAALRRNPLIIPDSPKSVKFIDLEEVVSDDTGNYDHCPGINAEDKPRDMPWSQLVLVADFSTENGVKVLGEAVKLRIDHPEIEFIVAPRTPEEDHGDTYQAAEEVIENWVDDFGAHDIISKSFRKTDNLSRCGKLSREISKKTGLLDHESSAGVIIYNGRLVGPIPQDSNFTKDDLELLINYEFYHRSQIFYEPLRDLNLDDRFTSATQFSDLTVVISKAILPDDSEGIYETPLNLRTQIYNEWKSDHTLISAGDADEPVIQIVASIDPASETAQKWVPTLKALSEMSGISIRIFLNPLDRLEELPIKRFYRYVIEPKPTFADDGRRINARAHFSDLPSSALLTAGLDVPSSWLVAPKECVHDLDNIKLDTQQEGSSVDAIYELESILIEGHTRESSANAPPRGVQLVLNTLDDRQNSDTIIMANLGYFQFKANPGAFKISLKEGRSSEIYEILTIGASASDPANVDKHTEVYVTDFKGITLFPRLNRREGKEEENVLEPSSSTAFNVISNGIDALDTYLESFGLSDIKENQYVIKAKEYGSDLLSKVGFSLHSLKFRSHAEINIFSVASGHLYERMLSIMMVSVMRHTNHTVKFWFIEQFLSPSFKQFLPHLAAEYGFKYEMVTYKWPHWLRDQKEKQREIWGYKILFLDVLFPLDLDKVIFVDADQIVRTDMYDLASYDLQGAPYGFTPMCDSRTEMEGFRFWKQGYWKNLLGSTYPYHISALFVVDLKIFRQIAAGDRLRQNYQQLSADPESLSNLDQDLPNSMQMAIPIHSLPQEWLWCETWCSDESLKDARTIDLCNNPLTKEPKLDRAKRQVPEWTVYDEEIRLLATRIEAGETTLGDKSGAESLSEKSSAIISHHEEL